METAERLGVKLFVLAKNGTKSRRKPYLLMNIYIISGIIVQPYKMIFY